LDRVENTIVVLKSVFSW